MLRALSKTKGTKGNKVKKSSTLVSPALLRRWPLPELDGTLGKDDRGQVMVMGGSTKMPGAVILGATGALRAGAGTLQIATSLGVSPLVAVTVPEACVFGLAHDRKGEIKANAWRTLVDELSECQSILVGPGMMNAAAAIGLIKHCVREELGAPIVVDAKALELFRDLVPVPGVKAGRIVMTPHAGEMAKLCGISREKVLADPLAVARDTASKLGVIVVLKGECTHIVAPDGTAFHNTAGNLGLGTSGSGDTLSGVIAGLCARGAHPLQAAVWGVHLHARAGEVLARKVAPLGFLARELLAEIPPLLAGFCTSTS